MSESLTRFLIELATNPGLLSEYWRDRSAYLDRSRLSAEEKAAVLSGDELTIAGLIARAGLTAQAATSSKAAGTHKKPAGVHKKPAGVHKARPKPRKKKKAAKK